MDRDRGRKRPDAADILPADKRVCPASTSSSSNNAVASSSSDPNGDVDYSSDEDHGRGGYGSCYSDSDDFHGPGGGGYVGVQVRSTASTAALQRILPNLNDSGTELPALMELCELLALSMEDSLPWFPMDTAGPVLVRLAREGSAEVMLLSVRAITYLFDAMPRSPDTLVGLGIVPVLVERLLAIEYLDLAEQCLQALEKISKRQPIACLEAAAITAVLNYIDFFSTSIQRVAVSTVANICKKVPVDHSPAVMEAVPTLCNLLQYEDKKLVETVATCFIRIAESFSQSPCLLDELCKQGVINRSVQLIAAEGRMTLSESTYAGLIGLLAKLATGSLVAVRTLFELNISSTLKGILATCDLSHNSPYSFVEYKQSNQIYEVLRLLNQLLSPVPKEVEGTQLALAKGEFPIDQPNLLHQFSMDVFPVLIQMVNSGANLQICYGCLSIINSIVNFSPADLLLVLVKDTNISSFLAGLLSRKDHHVLFLTLRIAELLVQKLHGVFSSSFVKEGVIHAIDSLFVPEESLPSTSPLSENEQCLVNQTTIRGVSRCLCYAFTSWHLPSSEMKACTLSRGTVCDLAKRIKSTYFNTESEEFHMCFSETLQKLKAVCSTLNENVARSLVDDVYARKEEYLAQMLDGVMGELTRGETMSTFEFIESRVARSLALYLSNGKYLQGDLCTLNLSEHFLTVLKRFQTFAFFCILKGGPNSEDMLLTSLVRKLQTALSSLDDFPVVAIHPSKPRNFYADIPVRHSTLHPCVKVQFVRDEGEATLTDFNDVLTAEISSSLVEVESFLWPKVCPSKTEHQERPAGQDIVKMIHTVSECKLADVIRDQELHAEISQNSSSSMSEGLGNQEQEKLPRDATAEGSSNLSSCKLEHLGGRRSFQIAQPKLSFSMGGKPLDRSVTLYQAILQDHINSQVHDTTVGPKFWHEVYRVAYKSAKEESNPQVSFEAASSSLPWDKFGLSWQKLSFFSTMFLAELPCKLDKSKSSYDILYLLKILEGLNRYSFYLLAEERTKSFAEGRLQDFDDMKVAVSSIPQSEFISSKLSDKLEQQMRDPLVLITGCMPLWCKHLMATCSFLFTFETRSKYLHLTVFGSSRVQQSQLHQSNSIGTSYVNDRWSQAGRKRFKVDRSDILLSAAKMMASHARSKAYIEVEYLEEVGTGLGPTMEFYTLVSHEIQKVGLGMWRDDYGSFVALSQADTSKPVDPCELVKAPFGLFPRPWSAASFSSGIQFSEVLKMFVLLGQLIAKAIKDGRIVDLPFSKAFYKLILGQELGIYDIQSFDPQFGRTLLEFHALVSRRKWIERMPGESSVNASDLRYRNMRIEDLCLDFTLPGYADFVLTSGCDSNMVNSLNLEEYISLVVDATVGSGISRQVDAFKSGFNEVFPLENLQIFSEDELERLLCGERDTWDFDELLNHIKFEHGYTVSSPPVMMLLEIIQEFGCEQRRAFLRFVTGAPRLPLGGLAALNPKLTVVRKPSDLANMDLPSVMTCANYLKLPPYSSKERMKERLLYAITEGQGSFHLS